MRKLNKFIKVTAIIHTNSALQILLEWVNLNQLNWCNFKIILKKLNWFFIKLTKFYYIKLNYI
jgi:hypothetical protein